jgi:plasmid stability protein
VRPDLITLISHLGRILIRDLDDSLLDALRSRAAAAGSWLEEEARRALDGAVGLGREAALARLDAVRTRIGPLAGPTSLDDLRTDRDRDS